LEQKTVNLVIVIAAVVIAAGAWSAPLLTAQTTHTLIQSDLADAVTTINQNTDSETGQIGAGFFGAGTDLDASFGDCTMMDLMISIALDENINQLCSPDTIQAFIESDIHFAEFSDQFEFEEQFLEILPMKLLPDRDCSGGDLLSDAQTFQIKDNANADVLLPGTAGIGVFGARVCIQELSFEDSPLRVKGISVYNFNGVIDERMRLQLALIDREEIPGGDGDQECGDSVALFTDNLIYDGTFGFASGDSVRSVSGDLMILLPPDGNVNICARAADDNGVGVNNWQVWLTVQEILPLNIINFIPLPDFQFFEFEHFAPVDFGDTCTISVLVQDFNNNDLVGIPVTLLDPFIAANVNGPANAIETDANGIVTFGAARPSGFYVIDVNVFEPNFPGGVEVDPNFGQSFPDRFIDCTDDEFGNSGSLAQDADGVDDTTVTVLALLPQFGGGGFAGATIGVFVENSSTGQAIPNITLTLSGTDFFGNTLVFADGEQNQVTDSFGEVEFEGLNSNLDGLPGGDYTISFAGSGGLQSATTMVFVPSGFTGFIDVFLPISPT